MEWNRSSMSSLVGTVIPMMGNEGWRRHGEARRRELLQKDKAEGGTSFFLNRKCSVQKYFEVADRVLAQFRDLYQHRSKLEETYVMGNRLIAFFSVALPKHPGYRSIDPAISALRDKSLFDLDWIRKRLEVIALRIDEEQFNRFIEQSKDVDTSTNTFETEDSTLDDSQWESFSGWSFEVSNESMDWKESIDISFDSNEVEAPEATFPEDEVSDDGAIFRHDRATATALEDEVSDPGDILDLESNANSEEEDDDDASVSDQDTFDTGDNGVRFAMEGEDEIDSTFLNAVKSEDVQYETDSEAVDSWDQDGGSEWSGPSAASPRVPVRYENDQERMTMEYLMNKVESSSVMRVSPDEELLGIHRKVEHDNVQQPSMASLFAPHGRLDGINELPETPTSVARRRVLGIRHFPSPETPEAEIPDGAGVTFEMDGIAPRRRFQFVETTSQNRAAGPSWHSARVRHHTAPSSSLESRFTEFSVGSNHDEKVVVATSGEVAVHPGRRCIRSNVVRK